MPLLEESALSEVSREGGPDGVAPTGPKGFGGLASLVSDPHRPSHHPISDDALPPNQDGRQTAIGPSPDATVAPADSRVHPRPQPRLISVKLVLWLLISVVGFGWFVSTLIQDRADDSLRVVAQDTAASALQDTSESPDSVANLAFKSVYSGLVTNSGVPESPASFTIGFDSIMNETSGTATIGAPLSGSGPFVAIIRSDSVFLFSVSASSDTIFWKATRRREELIGDYELVGGPMRGQHGTWEVHFTGGSPLVFH